MSSGVTSLSHSNSIAVWQSIEPICIAFDEAWQQQQKQSSHESQPEHPSLDDFLHLNADLPQELLLEELLRIELFYRRSAGEQITAEDYCARFPQSQGIIERVFAAQPHLPHRADFVPQAIVQRYQIIEELGRGSFAVVYLAHDQELERNVAIKIPGNEKRASSQQLLRLLEEARAAARLRHPGIVAIYDVQPLADGGVFAVLEYVAGKTLRQWASSDSLTWQDVATLFADIADAVAYAHARGFIHRDLHPENIIIDEHGAPHILDFGLAIHEDDQATFAGERAGSLPYMSPEQVRGESHRLDGRSDIWAIGAMLYEALTGRRAFAGTFEEQVLDEILHRDLKPARQIRAEIPVQLERICRRCLSKKPEDRFSTAGDLANELRRVVATRARRISRRASLAATIIALCCLPAIYLGWHYASNRGAANDRLDVDLLVWKKGQWNSIQQNSDMLPLHDGDQLRINAHSTRRRYLYIAWIDAQGVVSPVFPWLQGDWQQRPNERARTSVYLPAGGADEVWPMRVPSAGCEVVLLFGRTTPLPTNVNLTERLQSLPRLSLAPNLASGVRLDYWQFTALSTQRTIDLERTEHIRAPIVDFQRALKETMEPLFPEMKCLVIPVTR